jgi:hypothetical protein
LTHGITQHVDGLAETEVKRRIAHGSTCNCLN